MNRAWYLALAALIFIVDRFTKIMIEKHFSVYDTLTVVPGFFDLVHTKNRGAAFGMFSEGDGFWRSALLIGVSVAVLCFISYMLLLPGRGGFPASKLTSIGLALVMGGALGNIYDRIAYGMVTDFLEFYYGSFRFAAFNIADSAITVGAALLIIDMWFSKREQARTT